MSSGDQNYKEACSHYERGELEESIKLFTKAIDYYSISQEDEKKIKAHYYRGCAFYRLGIQCERNQMFEESDENFEKALEDFEEVSEIINGLYPNKIEEINKKFKAVSKEFEEVPEKINRSNNITADIISSFNNAYNIFTKFKNNNNKLFPNQLKETKGKFDVVLENSNEVYIQINEIYIQVEEYVEIKKVIDNALKGIEEISKKINELFSFYYYAGCT